MGKEQHDCQHDHEGIDLDIMGAIPNKKEDGEELTAKEFVASVEEIFKSTSTTYASTLIMKMCTSCYDG